MDPKERFKQALASEKETLSRQPIADEGVAAARRERWAQAVAPVIAFVDWLRTQVEGEFSIGDSRVEQSDHWTTDLYVAHTPRNAAGSAISFYTEGILKMTVTPESKAPFCWSTLDAQGLWPKDTRCHEDLGTFLDEVADYAARGYARVQQQRAGRTRKT